MAGPRCCVCSRAMQLTRLAGWCFRCQGCGTWGSRCRVRDRVNVAETDPIDEDLRETGLTTLRQQNNLRIVDRLKSEVKPGRTVSDVGCAHGWFVLAAEKASGFRAEGIEPDRTVAQRAASRGVTVRAGLFPNALGPDEQFDVIAFNDVLEHLPDIRQTIAACHRHLRPGGLLSINIPNSQGLVYRLAATRRRRGLAPSLFDRLWQVGSAVPAPLGTSIAPGSTRLCESEGFQAAYSDSLREHLSSRVVAACPLRSSPLGINRGWSCGRPCSDTDPQRKARERHHASAFAPSPDQARRLVPGRSALKTPRGRHSRDTAVIDRMASPGSTPLVRPASRAFQEARVPQRELAFALRVSPAHGCVAR